MTKFMKSKINQMVCLLGVTMVFIGIFSPWVKWQSWGSHPSGFVLGIETADGWILLVFAILASISLFKSTSDVGIVFLRLFPSIIITLGGWLALDYFWTFAPYGVYRVLMERGIGCPLIVYGGSILLISGLWELYAWMKMRSLH